MKRRKVKILVFVCGLLALLLCVVAFYLFSLPTSDEARYRAMARDDRLIAKIRRLENRRFGRLLRPLHISDFYIKRFENQRDTLLTAGYLTNVSITVTNTTRRDFDILNRVTYAIEGTDIEVGKLEWQSNCVSLVCRPKDIPLLRKALEE